MPDLYIGKAFNPADRSLGEPFKLDSSDLTTHGIVIGMTGSGKTGLSISLIEELLRGKVPVIVIDPKGDMGNLGLAFDKLAPEQFAPWIDKDEAAREGKDLAEVASDTAAMWTKGLADWDISAADVAAYSSSRRIRVFTPGASAGIPLNLIDSIAAPDGDFEANEEEYRDEIDSIVTALLGFVKIDSDPVSSREYILLFSLIENAWRKGQDLDLESLIGQVANPPIEKVGALPMDAFYPAKERNGLMFALNNLVASPPFEAWRQGEPIDIEKWVRSDDGKPQLSIVYTAHLDDEQRTFVTALVLNKLKTWMRKQPGTSELRCLFYMDEIFGYFPPNGNPPTKKPLLTLLKQARAYGVGILLSTQNPVDLDYKGLGNMGFWAIGRLQTEQDQERVREGIEGALANLPGGASFKELIAGVQKRVFLIHDIHRKAPQLVHSRWAMSYLRGPITKDEIRDLGPDVVSWTPAAAVSGKTAATGEAASAGTATPTRPVVPAPLTSRYLDRHGGQLANPYLCVRAAVRYKVGGVAGDEETRTLAFAMPAGIAAGELLESEPLAIDEGALGEDPPAGIQHAELPAFLATNGAKTVERVVRDRLDDRLAAELLFDPISKKFAASGESEFDFAARLSREPAANSKRSAIELKIAKKRADLQVKKRDMEGRKAEKWASIGTSILGNIGLFSGRKKRVTGVSTVLSKNRMENTAEARVEDIEQDIAALEQDLAALSVVDPSRFERRTVKPAKTDVSIIRFDVLWVY
jgi:Helicase HerA, central domain